MAHKKTFLSGQRIYPDPIRSGMPVDRLIDETFLAYNGGRLQKACRLFSERMLDEDVTVGLSLSGALTPAGVGRSCIIPLIKAGFIDWIVSTGANLYHDTHYGLGMSLHRGAHDVDDTLLRREGIIRIYDILFDYNVLLDTDNYLRAIMAEKPFARDMSTAELHYLLGKYLAAREKEMGVEDTCVLTVAYRAGVPCYVSSPGDSSIGMNIAELAMRGTGPRIDVSLDVNETAGIVYAAKQGDGKSGILMLGGGSPKNFVLQTEPQIQEILGLTDRGHDYFIQVTDARADTGGLSGATPSEAVSWGKIDPDRLTDSVVVYADSTIAGPLLTAYVLSRVKPRKLKRLYDRRPEMVERLKKDFLAEHERRLKASRVGQSR
ncbi:MAG TPA: deoxyhypusine synthase [Candidatus Polarisedimenticolia bacterium]|jgi:deoxyhypusine synthase|nr:deoxyhypusine synthase [Candidatus Polarisedimenticolia bacterium]